MGLLLEIAFIIESVQVVARKPFTGNTREMKAGTGNMVWFPKFLPMQKHWNDPLNLYSIQGSFCWLQCRKTVMQEIIWEYVKTTFFLKHIHIWNFKGETLLTSQLQKKKIQTLKHTYEIKSILGLRNHSLEPYIT